MASNRGAGTRACRAGIHPGASPGPLAVRNSVIAAMLGIAVTCADLFADHGELSPPVMMIFFAIAGGLTVAVRTQFSLPLLLLVAVWMPGAHLALHAAGVKTTLQPDTVTSILLVGLASFVAVIVGGLIGTAILRAIPAQASAVRRRAMR